MKMVYILTKEGQEYTEEGYMCVTSKIREYFKEFDISKIRECFKGFVTSKIRECFKETEEFVFCEGAVYNNTELFKELLLSQLGTEDVPGCYIVVSYSSGIAIIGGTRRSVENFITDVERHPGESSWEIFYGECCASVEQ